jgi:thiamine kinase-like enzyme
MWFPFFMFISNMNQAIEQQILEVTGASSVSNIDFVQSLWSDFGALKRVHLVGGRYDSVVVKQIEFPTKMLHPRGWNSIASAERKLKSYEIERTWYQEYAAGLPLELKVPRMFASIEHRDSTVLVLEDLKASGFSHDFQFATNNHFDACLRWLAQFHAFHLGKQPKWLWETATYWHLQTRREEFEVMADSPLKKYAHEIDRVLNRCKYQTLVHGDAKPANFLFSDSGQAAAVDFQYIGGGCGIKDVVYLMSSTLSEEELFERDQDILSNYFEYLRNAIHAYHNDKIRFDDILGEWMSLYVFAWADFARFLEGWSPQHKRRNAYLDKQVREAVHLLNLS